MRIVIPFVIAALVTAASAPAQSDVDVKDDVATRFTKSKGASLLAGVVPQSHRMVKADAFCLSVAAASILAKVTRDRLMRQFAAAFPVWSFDTNKGYPCPLHKAALHAYGPSAVHRRSWVFMDGLAWPGLRYHRPEQATLFD